MSETAQARRSGRGGRGSGRRRVRGGVGRVRGYVAAQRGGHCRDRGSVSLVMVILAVVLFMAAGLVIDGGAALAARGRAASLAQQASRAGLGALDPASLRGRSPAEIVVDPAGAAGAARRVLAAGGAQGDVSVAGDTVTVTARVRRRAVVLSAFGLTDLTGTATASATLVHGTTSGTPVGGTQ